MQERGRHGRESFLIGDKMVVMQADGSRAVTQASNLELSTEFRFSRFAGDDVAGEAPHSLELLSQLAVQMTSTTNPLKTGDVPAGYTYLGQFVDHDLTLDKTQLDLNATTIADLKSLRSPTLDLDSLYGRGPGQDPQFYESDGLHLKTGTPFPVPNVPQLAAQKGFDLQRLGVDSAAGPARRALIPDLRNDENLAVAQVHLAMVRFHNRVVDELAAGGVTLGLFEQARRKVVLHYQHMLRTDYLPRIVQNSVVEDVFANGRKVFEVGFDSSNATMPVEFSGAAFRLGHSMIRVGYSWNTIFDAPADGHIFRLFRFSGTSGNLLPPTHGPGTPEDLDQLEGNQQPFGGLGKALPSNWVADWPRLFDMGSLAPGLARPANQFNLASIIDTTVVNPMEMLPIGSFAAVGDTTLIKKRNLAFRNLVRGNMLRLPTGEQLAAAMLARGLDIRALDESEVVNGSGGIALNRNDVPALDEIKGNTPLWFYVLREAEANGGRLAGVGARIVAETFHRAIQASNVSLLALPFQVEFGPGAAQNRFGMADLLFYAYGDDPKNLNPTQA